ncbi:MAG: thiol-disulfide oxidoreductase DCC family protein [bacterium]
MNKTTTTVLSPNGRESEAAIRSVVFYDGVCALCHWTVKFLIKIDRQATLRFAPLQGKTVRKFTLVPTEPSEKAQGVIYVQNADTLQERTFFQSDAILEIFKEIGGIWRTVAWLRIIPVSFRNALYKMIAKNRYKWFGKYSTCRLPETTDRHRFLE